jgi:hypothetical protein
MGTNYRKLSVGFGVLLLAATLGVHPAFAATEKGNVFLKWSPRITDTDCFESAGKKDYIKFDVPRNIEHSDDPTAWVREEGSDQGALASAPATKGIVEFNGKHRGEKYEIWISSGTTPNGNYIGTEKSTVWFQERWWSCSAGIERQGQGGEWPK